MKTEFYRQSFVQAFQLYVLYCIDDTATNVFYTLAEHAALQISRDALVSQGTVNIAAGDPARLARRLG